jgi:uncharacterized protein YjbI with pentapeptide repeats
VTANRGYFTVRTAAGIGIAALVAWMSGASTGANAADCRADPSPQVDWQGCKKDMLLLQGSHLDGANLGEAVLDATDLRSASLAGANLEKAKLVRASLAGAKAQKANFARIEAYRTVFSGIAAEGASFAAAELQRADFTNAALIGATFEKAELGRADFSGATLSNVSFAMANLSRAELEKSKVEGPLDFTGAFLFLTRLDGLDLSAAVGLQQAQVDQACGDDATVLPQGLAKPAAWPCNFQFD